MAEVEIWAPTRRTNLRVEAARQTESGRRFHLQVHDWAMENLAVRIKIGAYTPTEQDLIELEEWRKDKARRDAEAENAAE